MTRPVRDWTERLWRFFEDASSSSTLTGERVLVQIDEDRRRVRQGILFTVSDRRQVASAAVDNVLLRVGSLPTAMRFQITSELELDVEFREAVTADPAGATLLPLRARNRITSDASEAAIETLVYDDVTVSDAGTLLLDTYIPAGQKNAGVGGGGNSDVPFGLKANTDYLFRITNLAAATNEISLILTISEDWR